MNTDLEVCAPGRGERTEPPEWSADTESHRVQLPGMGEMVGQSAGAREPRESLWGGPWPRALTSRPHPLTVRSTLRRGITSNICHRPCAVCLMQRQHLLEFLRPSAPEMVFPCSAPTSKGELWDLEGTELSSETDCTIQRHGPALPATQMRTVFSDTSRPPFYCDLRVCGTARVLTHTAAR